MSATIRYTVALRDVLTGRYGTARLSKAGSPAEAVIKAIQGPRRSTTLTVDDVEHLGGERYKVAGRVYRVRVWS